ncbi:MAG TPA: mismatch-specific DNA-glycosylase [Chloroflexota bacterium]|nr:mismatch-specific DNA-glycosylase [Chloroflexota bacterium]
MQQPAPYLFETLPDYLAPGMRLLLAGINPSVYSVRQGRYFARKTSRFWPAFSRSRLSAEVRAGLGRDELGPADDARLLGFGIGFTDVVKVPSANASQIPPALFAEWAPVLRRRIDQLQPVVAAFQGVTAYRAFERYALGVPKSMAGLGAQATTIGRTRLFVVPNPSPANAHVRPSDQVAWYDQLADFVEQAAGSRSQG